jgi:hypothetical protein
MAVEKPSPLTVNCTRYGVLLCMRTRMGTSTLGPALPPMTGYRTRESTGSGPGFTIVIFVA